MNQSYRMLSVCGHQIGALSLNAPDTPGHPIILLHGVMSSMRYWTPDQTELFTGQGVCYALTLPGHYPAVFPPDFRLHQLTAEMMADVLIAAVRQLVSDRPVTLIGFSTGGFAALAMAACAPELASRVVSISGFAQGRWTGWLGAFQRWARAGRWGHLRYKLMNLIGRVSPRLFHSLWHIYAADVKAMYAYPPFRACADANYPDYCSLDLNNMLLYFAAMPDIDITGWLPRIKAPTLALAGDADPIVPPEQARLIAQHVPRGDLALIKGGGHILFAERAEEYRRVLRDWLS